MFRIAVEQWTDTSQKIETWLRAYNLISRLKDRIRVSQTIHEETIRHVIICATPNTTCVLLLYYVNSMYWIVDVVAFKYK